MEFDEWEPVYRSIRADFGYERSADERARDRLKTLLAGGDPLSLAELDVAGETVGIAGGAPGLTAEVDVLAGADAVFAASGAGPVVADAGIEPDCVVTDLDGDPERIRELNLTGTPVAVHAHGDNGDRLAEYVPTMATEALLPTTQAAPVRPVVNPGGFTDGDRAAFLADELGADSLVFAGWDFDDPSVSREKARKLAWAERLLYWLEQRRSEAFSVLEGRREGIDASALPVE